MTAAILAFQIIAAPRPHPYQKEWDDYVRSMETRGYAQGLLDSRNEVMLALVAATDPAVINVLHRLQRSIVDLAQPLLDAAGDAATDEVEHG